MKNLLLIFTFSILFFSCQKDQTIEPLEFEITDTTTLEEDNQTLSDIWKKITSLSDSKPCNNSIQWSFVSYGSKACGGPIGFIAYSKNINTSDFLNKIKVHKQLQDTYNSKYGTISTCDIPPSPKNVKCENGKPILVY